MSTVITAGNATNGLSFTADNAGTFDFKTGTGAGTTAVTIDASQNVAVTGNLTLTGNASGVLKSGTAVTASGTSIDFTGIPSTVKRITIMLSGVSTNGTSFALIQIGNGSPETTGYLSGEGYIPAPGVTSVTTGFPIHLNNASNVEHGAMVLVSLGSNKWVMTYTGYDSGNTYLHFSAGSKTTSAAPDRVRITTVNGTDTFDAGTINILYE